jgi:cytochrome c oxidase subunit 4
MAEHIESKKNYFLVFLALIVLTFVTTGIAYLDLGPLNTPLALIIAVMKMLLVALFFMHVRYSTRLTKLVLAGGLLWLAILLALTMSDYISRAWMAAPGG